MAEINVPKELVENHTTEEVVTYVVKGLKQAIRDYEDREDSAVAGGVLAVNVALAAAYLDALDKKLKPRDPVVA